MQGHKTHTNKTAVMTSDNVEVPDCFVVIQLYLSRSFFWPGC